MPNRSPPVVLVCQPFLFQKIGTWREILESAGFEVKFPRVGGCVLTEEQLASDLDRALATIASTEPYTPSILQRATSLRVISRTGVGYDSIDMRAATDRGVVVACTPGTNHEAVAEHAFALLLAVAKRIVPGHAEVAQGGFRRQPSLALRGKTLGLVGLGRTGRAMARRAATFDMHVLAYDPFLTTLPSDARGVELVAFEELLARCDIISLHAAATEGTSRLIRRETLDQMKKGVVLVNTARGSLIDEAALTEALQSGEVAAAGLDVFEREPPAGSPLLSAPNVVFSPHLAGIDEQAFEDMATMAAQTIVDLYQWRWPVERLVNADQLPQPWKWA
jgi:D-3-phosphoglycerate dehydrogenase / 2-oxoglutarate reductase